MNTCRTCKHATTSCGYEKMYRQGYRNCAHKPEHIFVPGHQVCTFNPSKWEKNQ